MEKELIEEYLPENYNSIEEFFDQAYPADIAEVLMKIPEESIKTILDEFSIKDKAEIISYLDDKTTKNVSKIYDETVISEIIRSMYADDAADFLGTMSIGKIKKTLKLMKTNQAEELQELLDFDEESAGGIMNTDYIAFYEEDSVDEVINKIRNLIPDQEMIYYIYIIDNKKELVGVLSVRQLLGAQPDTKLKVLMSDNVIKVNVNTDQEEVAQVLSKYDLLAVPVVNKKNQLMGIVTVDDALDVIEAENTEDMLRMVGVNKEEKVDSSLKKSIKGRLPWLYINLGTAFLAAFTVSLFEDVISQVVALAVAMPIVAGMGGNAGTQTLSVVIRGIALGEVDFKQNWKYLLKEIILGFINGAATGVLTGLILYLMYGNFYLGGIIFLAMIINLMIAGLFGFLIPLILKKLGVDPALASSIFLTTATDVFGFFVFLGLAKVFLVFLK